MAMIWTGGGGMRLVILMAVLTALQSCRGVPLVPFI
jgi:hypothetical protein